MFFKKLLTLLLISSVVSGCMTIHRAKIAQCAIAEGTSGEETPVLSGFPLAQYVDFALTNRPSVLSAELAVVDARLALKQLAADAPVQEKTQPTSAQK